jgi:alcohol dehydrogenase class IV
MVNKFGLLRTPRIIFGEGQAATLPILLKNHGRRILIITGSQSYRQNPSIPRLFSILEESNYRLSFERMVKEPSPEDIDRIVRKNDPDDLDVVLAIGGGSVLDAGKAVAAMLYADGPVQDYLEGVGKKTHSGVKKFFTAVPTTSGTGSEATSNAVLSVVGTHGFKRSLRHENFVPDLAVVDPLLTLECPPDITAHSGMDAFTQLVESYLSVKASPVTDALALEGIEKIRTSLEVAVNNGKDVVARSGMAYAALLSGITLSNAGLGLIHGFASALGGFFDIPHGVVCGTLMGVVNRYNTERLIRMPEVTMAHTKYARLGRLLSGETDKELHWYIKFTADYIEELTEKLHIRRLGEFGIKESDLEKVVAASDHKANPLTFKKRELIEMLQKRL